MATSGEMHTVALPAGADLRAAQYKVIGVAGTIAAANDAAFGILQNKPNTNEGATVCYAGHAKAYVGGTVTAGGRLKVTTSGWLVAVASGDGSCAKALTAANSGSVCEVLCNFVSAATTY